MTFQEKSITSPAGKVRRPGEFEKHAQTWMAWPHRADLYGDLLDDVQKGYVAVAKAISEFEPVTMVAHPAQATKARSMLGNHASVTEIAIDDCWARDSGPTFVQNADGSGAGVSWQFNAWGGKHAPFDKDDELAERILENQGMKMRRSWLHCEGGSLCCDGEGTLIVTETSILNPNRNPGISKAFAEAELKEMLGLDKVIWLPGDPLDMETDGHIDGMCTYVRPGVVLFECNNNPDDVHGRILRQNLAVLEKETDAKGRKLEIIMLPEAADATITSDVFCRSYINFYLPNGGLILPVYGIASDQEAIRIVSAAYPDRKVVTIDVNAIAPGGGSIHCITQEQFEFHPKGA